MRVKDENDSMLRHCKLQKLLLRKQSSEHVLERARAFGSSDTVIVLRSGSVVLDMQLDHSYSHLQETLISLQLGAS